MMKRSKRELTTAWYPRGEEHDKNSVIAWVAPADNSWTAHLERPVKDRVPGLLTRELAEKTAERMMQRHGWDVSRVSEIGAPEPVVPSGTKIAKWVGGVSVLAFVATLAGFWGLKYFGVLP